MDLFLMEIFHVFFMFLKYFDEAEIYVSLGLIELLRLGFEEGKDLGMSMLGFHRFLYTCCDDYYID